MDLFAPIPSLFNGEGTFVAYDFDNLEDEALQALISAYEARIAEITANPAEFVSAEFSTAELLDATKAAIEALAALKDESTARAADPVLPPEPEAPAAPELSDEDRAAFAELANAEEAEEPSEPEAPAEEEAEAEAAVVAAAVRPPARRGRMPAPTAARQPAEHEPPEPASVALLAAGGAYGMPVGSRFGSELDLAQAMCDRHRQFGQTAPGTTERFAIAKATWKDDYPEERRLRGTDEISNFDVINQVIQPAAIKRALADRRNAVDKDLSLVASGGLCAPVTPYYNLQYISVPVRPVLGSLPSFNADRGGLRYARPAGLSSITDAVGIITEAEDSEGGTFSQKTCQVIDCPDFIETDVDALYHCLQFGNLGARAFPELVAQWNNLVLASHARLAESNLLTQIDAFSTQVTAATIGLGATGDLLGQILAAANGMRNRNRMDPEAVLRLMMPDWSVDLLLSDVLRGQFQRFDTDEAKIVALLRSFDIEPTFYIDGANGRDQVFGAQADGPLLTFPPTVTWYLFPEGSFLFLDGGQLELGIVRDSVLNKTNDFQIFGETWENVAFVGVEALAVESTLCDSGTVTLPKAITCPIDYAA